MQYITKLLIEAGISNERQAKKAGIPSATYYRMKNGRANKYLIEALKLRAGYSKHWEGVKIREGYVITPDGEKIHKNQILSIRYGERLAYQRGLEEGRTKPAQFQLAI